MFGASSRLTTSTVISYPFVATILLLLSSVASISLCHNMDSVREVVKDVESVEQGEGVGARVRRSIGRPELRNLDPFLMLDEFRVGQPAGFPDHPHRGFETVTYMLNGAMLHEDFCGHKGVIYPGDLQWMTAGKGIVHSEMPQGEEQAHGLQLWVNLSSKDKMVEPRYQELLGKDIPKIDKDGIKCVVIAGEAFDGTKSPVYTLTPTMYLDFELEKGKVLEQPVPEGWNAFMYTLRGDVRVGGKRHHASAHHTLVLGGNGNVRVEAGEDGARFVLLGGKPHGEPIVQHGPFVMNNDQQIFQTFMDYQQGKNGFENAPGWESDTVKSRSYF
mmetsp:Transcript_23008/g.58342  ORF Transcript_23008/g.58342 Transcript_23008/m.58342 type:complete len:330 (-) Transcript_23008:139-1128(-)